MFLTSFMDLGDLELEGKLCLVHEKLFSKFFNHCAHFTALLSSSIPVLFPYTCFLLHFTSSPFSTTKTMLSEYVRLFCDLLFLYLCALLGYA